MIPELERRWNPPDTMVDQYGNVHTLYKDHSIPPSAIDAKRIADICRILGTVYHGTVIAGKGEGVDKKTARVVIGQDAKGIQAYDDASRSFFTLNWEDQSFRLGYIDSPQVRMRSGNVEIDGDCTVDGTLSASKIIVGDSWVRTLIAGGLLAIGTGDAETPDNPADLFSGFRVSHATASASGKSTVWQRRAKVAGFLAGAMTFAIDTATGEFLSFGADENDDTYISLRQGVWTITNDETAGDVGVTKLLFRTKHYSFGDEVTSDFYLHGGPTGLTLYRNDTLQQPAVELWMDHEADGVTTRQRVASYGCEIMHMAVIPAAATPNWYDTWVRGDAVWFTSLRRRFRFVGDVEIDSADIKLNGAHKWVPNELGVWADLPDAGANDRILMPDPDTGDLKYWTGTAWTTVTTS